MPHETSLIATLVAALGLALAFGFIAGHLRLPRLAGYLLAGIAVGPHTPGFVADSRLAGQLAEIGVILLMFGVGLHFSIKDLLAVRRVALPGALVQMAATTALGLGIARLWGWDAGAALVFGLALSVASTVVLLRALGERRGLDSPHGRIAVGWLIVQDLAMVLVLVLLPVLAETLGGTATRARPAAFGDHITLTLAVTLGKIAAFVVLIVVIGRRLLPLLLEIVARTGSRELFTLSVLSVALGIAYGSVELFGASLALGAFFAGVVLSGSDLSHQAAADTVPLRDAFAVLFFVSVGMLFEPAILIREPLHVVLVLVVILMITPAIALTIALAFGYPVATGLLLAAGLAQIGEFSFILASLGLHLGLLPPQGRDLIVAAALISITLNPLAFLAADRLARWVEARPHLKRRIEDLAAGPPPSLVDSRPRPAGDHAIIVGFGRVGQAIARALDIWELPYIVVERDRRLVESVRGQGHVVVWGDAAAPGILAAAGVDRARIVIVAAPDAFQAARIVDIARAANGDIDTVVRAHSEAELHHVEKRGVGLAVLADHELALSMVGYALRRLGLSHGEVQMFVQSSRQFDEAGMKPATTPAVGAPELQPHRDEP